MADDDGPDVNDVPPEVNRKRPFGSAARLYRDMGWMGTLWLPAHEKDAPPTGFTGKGAPYPTDAQVERWITNHGDGNICLRLGAVTVPIDAPLMYAGQQVTAWEFIGIDVDAYGDKHGDVELDDLERGINGAAGTLGALGVLPATATSSARWDSSTGKLCPSGIRVYKVPAGGQYKGKAAKSIDVIYAGLRYVVVWPSVHPSGAPYVWKYGAVAEGWTDFNGGIPGIADDVAILPETWYEYLFLGDDTGPADKSDLDYGELKDWARANFASPDTPCKLMRKEVADYIAAIDTSDSHTPMRDVTKRLLRNGFEGHHGWLWGLETYLSEWIEITGTSGKRDVHTMEEEIGRAVRGELAKMKAEWDQHEYIPDDTCAPDGGEFDCDAWAERNDKLEAADYGGLGPVVGKMAVLATKPVGEYGRHDDHNGQHLVDLYGANIRYIGARKNWILWDGDRWHRDNDDRLIRNAYRRVRKRQERYAAELREKVRLDPDDKVAAQLARAWTTWAKRSGDAGPVKSALEMSRHCYAGEEPVVLSANELDGNPVLLGCSNGTLDLTAVDDDGDLNICVRQPVKEDYVTYNTNVEYVPWRTLATEDTKYIDAFDIWQEYLDWFLPDLELQRFVRKALGHMLVGGNEEKKILFLFGPPDTGKSTMIGAIEGALGDYYGTINMQLFKHKELNPGLVRAVPLRVTGMSEMEETTKTGVIDAGVVKRLTGNDEIVAELKYSNEIFSGTPQFTTIIACNNPPTIRNADAGLYERLLVLPLESAIPMGKRRYERQRQIKKQCGPAVFAWLIEGWKDYHKERLARDTWPDVVKKANNVFASDLNTVARYVDTYLIRAKDTPEGRRALETAKRKSIEKNKKLVSCLPPVWTPSSAKLYDHYRETTRRAGEEPVDQVQFTRDLGCGRTDSRRLDGANTSVYVGVRYKEEPSEPAERFARKF